MRRARDGFRGGSEHSLRGGPADGRLRHTLTVLPSGSVLMAGGRRSAGGLVLATGRSFSLLEPTIREPASQPANLPTGHTATLLPSGQVLVAGSAVTDTEIYAPDAETWTVAGSTSVVRTGHTATLLPSGNVLLVGGDLSPGTTELFVPGSGWTSGPPLAFPRFAHTATLLPSGRVLIAGGRTSEGAAVDISELLDPAGGPELTAHHPTFLNDSHAAVLLVDGRVLVAGGMDKVGINQAAALYDPRSNSWSPPLLAQRSKERQGPVRRGE